MTLIAENAVVCFETEPGCVRWFSSSLYRCGQGRFWISASGGTEVVPIGATWWLA